MSDTDDKPGTEVPRQDQAAEDAVPEGKPQLSKIVAEAMEHHQAQRFQQAEVLYRQVLQHDPENVDALHLLGVLASQNGKHEAAVQLISKAIEIKPNVSVFYFNLGMALAALGRYEPALMCYVNTIELNPMDFKAHTRIADIFYLSGRIEEAIKQYEHVLTINPDFLEAHNGLSVARLKHDTARQKQEPKLFLKDTPPPEKLN